MTQEGCERGPSDDCSKEKNAGGSHTCLWKTDSTKTLSQEGCGQLILGIIFLSPVVMLSRPVFLLVGGCLNSFESKCSDRGS